MRHDTSSKYLKQLHLRNMRQPFSAAVLASLLLVWCVIVVVGHLKLANDSYLGVVLEGDADNKQLFVRSITNSGVAYQAGIRLGDRFDAIETVDGTQRYEFLGPEAYSGRQRIHSYQQHDEMLKAKRDLWEFVKLPEYVLVRETGERVVLIPESSSSWSSSYLLTAVIVIILFESLLMFLVAVGIFAFAKRSIGVTVLLVGGIGFSINAMANSFVVTREIMLDPSTYYWIQLPAKAGSTAFQYALLCLVWYIPNPISRFPFWQTMLAMAVFVYLAQALQFFEFPVHPYEFPNLMLLPLGIAISIAQWRKSSADPVTRATVQWLMMSIYGALIIVVILYNVPLILKQPPLINPLIASILWSFTFIGLALGTVRYKLFEVQRYWWKIVTWIVGGTLVILADLLLVSQFDFSQEQALPIALLLAGWIYFPIRHFLFEYFVTSRDTKMTNHIVDLIETFGGTKNAAAFDQRFASFAKKVFQAKDVDLHADGSTSGSFICENGLGLSMPNVSDSGSITLYGKADGKSLFSATDMVTADSFVKLIRNLKDIRLQEQEVLEEERSRIVRDLHDDVGGRLLNLIYKAPDSRLEEDARATLTALKESMIVIEDSESVDMELAWNQIVRDAEERLNEADFTLVAEEGISGKALYLTARQYVNLKRIMQEAVSNTIKHGSNGPVKLSLQVSADKHYHLRYRNNTSLASETNILNGRGIGNISKRIEEIGGSITLLENEMESSTDNIVFAIEMKFPGIESGI